MSSDEAATATATGKVIAKKKRKLVKLVKGGAKAKGEASFSSLP